MSQKLYHKILQWGIFASFLIFLLINNYWLYPYNTPKQIFFNILMEVLAVVWLALIVKYPSSRPPRSWLTWGFLAWLLILLVTCFTGVDFNLSFWGDANRMMGWFHLAHWFIFYLILITVFRTKADWQKLFILSLATAGAMVVYSLIKNPETGFDPGSTVNMGNNIGTLGHATHVAGVMLFCFYFALYGWFKSQIVYHKVLYAVAGLLALVGFFYSDVSGSQAGWAVSLVVGGLLYTFLAANKTTKKISLISVGAFILIIALLFSVRNASFMSNRFGKIFKDFSSANTNLDTRLYAWRSGWKGFLAKPVLGWGYGNFGVVYDKFFDGSYYNYTMDEEYFDRAHNNLIDLAVTTGAVGLAVYLLIFVFIAYYLIKGYRQKKFGWLELAIMAAIVIAYFIHNLAVFDFWGTYFMFWLAVAWLFWLYHGREEPLWAVKPAGNREIITWLAAGGGALWLIFNYNVAFAKSFVGTIKLTDVLRTVPQDQELLSYYQEPFKLNSPMDRSGIEVVVDFVDGGTPNLANLSRETKQQFLDYLIGLSRKVVAYNPGNSLSQARLGRTMMTACLMTEDKNYCYQSLEPLNKSMATGGQHVPVYQVKSVVQLYLNDVDGAIATLQQVLKFYDGYTKVNCQLAQIYLQLRGDSEVGRSTGRDYMKKCVAQGAGQDFAAGQGVVADEYKKAQNALQAEAEAKSANAKGDQYVALLKEGLRLKGEGDMGNRDSYYKSIEVFKQATALTDNKVWIPFLNLGNLYRIIGDYEQADVNYNKALEISGGDVMVYLAKIELYQLYVKKPPAEVMDLYQQALKTVTDNGNLMIGYAAFCRDNGYLKEALRAYESLAKSFPNNQSYQEEIAKLKAKIK
jgi:O-antigen ligase